MSTHPLLVAALIVRDEEDQLEDCLASLTGLVDRVEVLDTGSIDRTVEIALSHGAEVSHAEWRDDFAWARNQVLERCRDARYVLTIDADERIHCRDTESLRAMLAAVAPGSAVVNVETRHLDSGRLVASNWVARIFTPDGAEWQGAIHEQIRLPNGALGLHAEADLLAVDHIGFAAELRDQKDKAGRNVRIARARLESDPGTDSVFEYLRCLTGSGEDPEHVLAEFGRLLEPEPAFDDRQLSTVLGQYAAVLVNQGRWSEALGPARRAGDLVPANHHAALTEAVTLRHLGEDRAVIDRYDDLGHRPSVAPLVETVASRDDWLRNVFEAGVDLGDVRACLAVLGDHRFPAAFDPWPSVVRLAPADSPHGTEAARIAGQKGDMRFVAALRDMAGSGRPRPPEGPYTRGWVEGGGDPEVLALCFPRGCSLTLPPEPELIAAAARHEAEAIAPLAKRVADGHIDLELELELEASSPTAPAETLIEVAMVGLDRVPHTGALQLAEVLDPRRPRVAAVLARHLLAAGHDEEAAEVVEASDTSVAGALTTALLVDLGIVSNLRARGFDPAVALAADVVAQGAPIGVWSELVTAAATDLSRIAAVVAVAVEDDPAALLDAIDDLHPTLQLEYCAGLLAAGATNPRAVALGLISAGAARIDAAGVALCEWAHLLDPEMQETLADGLASLLPDTAAALRAAS